MVKILYWRTVWRMTQRCSYIPDDYTAQYESTLHLLAASYRQPLCFWLPESALATGYRRQGFEQAWRDAGRDLAEVKQFYMATGDDHYTDLESLLNAHFNRQTRFLMF